MDLYVFFDDGNGDVGHDVHPDCIFEIRYGGVLAVQRLGDDGFWHDKVVYNSTDWTVASYEQK